MSSDRMRTRGAFIEEAARRFPGITQQSILWAIRRGFVVPEPRQGGRFGFSEKQFSQLREYYFNRSRNFLIS